MKYTFSLWRTIATLGMAAIIVFSILAGGGALSFIHIPIFVFVFGICFLLMAGIYGKEFVSFLLNSFCVLFYQPAEPNPRFAKITLFGSRTVVGAACIAMLIGAIQMLQDLSAPDMIGRGMAVALLSPLYALILSEVFFAFVHQSFIEKSETADNHVIPLKNLGIPMSIIFFMVTTMLVLMITFSPGFLS